MSWHGLPERQAVVSANLLLSFGPFHLRKPRRREREVVRTWWTARTLPRMPRTGISGFHTISTKAYGGFRGLTPRQQVALAVGYSVNAAYFRTLFLDSGVLCSRVDRETQLICKALTLLRSRPTERHCSVFLGHFGSRLGSRSDRETLSSAFP